MYISPGIMRVGLRSVIGLLLALGLPQAEAGSAQDSIGGPVSDAASKIAEIPTETSTDAVATSKKGSAEEGLGEKNGAGSGGRRRRRSPHYTTGYYGQARRCERCVSPCELTLSSYKDAFCVTDRTHGSEGLTTKSLSIGGMPYSAQWVYGHCLPDGHPRLRSASTSNPKLMKQCREFKLDRQGLPKDIIQPVPPWSLTIMRNGINVGNPKKKKAAGDCSYVQDMTLGVRIKGRWALSATMGHKYCEIKDFIVPVPAPAPTPAPTAPPTPPTVVGHMLPDGIYVLESTGPPTPAPTITIPHKYSVTCRVFKYFNCRRNRRGKGDRVCKSKHQKSCISKMKCVVQKSAECIRVCRAKSNDKCDSRRCPADKGTCSKTCEVGGLPKDFWCRVQVAGL